MYQSSVRQSLPSPLVVATRNILRLLRERIRPGDSVLEIGFAPGKLLAYAAARLGARVSGIDYSDPGTRTAQHLFQSLGLQGNLRCEDAFSSTFPAETFDFVFSVGLVEHFDDPRGIVRKHVELTRAGGKAFVLVPNYGGIYGRLQARLDPANLKIHNLAIMSERSMLDLVPPDLTADARAFLTGRPNPWLLSFDKALPIPLAKAVAWSLNGLALLQPFDIRAVAPLIALEITRAGRE